MKKAKGLHEHRFKNNPEERRFAEAWAKQNEVSSNLACLLDAAHGVQPGRPPEPTDRDKIVAATVIQWLGSPVGRSFLQELGYEKREKR